jgi:hypothetical protein
MVSLALLKAQVCHFRGVNRIVEVWRVTVDTNYMQKADVKKGDHHDRPFLPTPGFQALTTSPWRTIHSSIGP